MKQVLFKIAAIFSLLFALSYILAAGALVSGSSTAQNIAAALLLLCAIIVLPAITASVGGPIRLPGLLLTVVGIFGYLCFAAAAFYLDQAGQAAVSVGLATVGAYFIGVSIGAYRLRAWPRSLCLLALISGVLHGFLATTLVPSVILIVLGGVQSVFFVCMAWRLWVCGGGWAPSKVFYRRAAIVAACVVVVVGAVWVYLDRTGAAMLDAELAKLRAAGAMTTLDDLLATIPEAAQDTEGKKVVDFVFSLDPKDFVKPVKVGKQDVFGERLNADVKGLLEQWSPEVAAAARQACDQNRALLDRAIEMCQLRSPKLGTWVDASKAKSLFSFKIPNLLAVKGIANLLSLDAVLACKDGRPDEALTLAGHILDMGNHMSSSVATLIAEMIAVAVRVTGTGLVQHLAQEADFSDVAIAAFDQSLERSLHSGSIRKCFELERLGLTDLFHTVRTGTYPDVSGVAGDVSLRVYGLRIFRFLLDRDEVTYLGLMNPAVDAYSLPLPEARRALASRGEEAKSLRWWTPITAIAIPNLPRAGLQKGQETAYLELTRVALGLMRFKRASGTYPDTLDALVPSYLAALPQDPFTLKPFIYRRDGDGYVLYSVGMDFKDDGGKDKDMEDLVWRMAR